LPSVIGPHGKANKKPHSAQLYTKAEAKANPPG